jgi:hypothetical protein
VVVSAVARTLLGVVEHGGDQLVVVGERRVEGRQHAGDRRAKGAGGERDDLVGAGVADRDAGSP